MEDNSFFMILTSESNLDTFPDNKPNSFTVQLDQTKELKENYECALHEVIFPKVKKNVEFECFLCYFLGESDLLDMNSYAGTKINVEENLLFPIKIGPLNVSGKHFEFLQEIFEYINKALDMDSIEKMILNKHPELISRGDSYSRREKPKVVCTKTNNKILIEIIFGLIEFKTKDGTDFETFIFFLFEENLYKIIGLKNKAIYPKNDKYLILFEPSHGGFLFPDEKFDVDISKSFISDEYLRRYTNVYLMCSIITDSYINDKKYKLLRIIHLDSDGRSKFIFEPKLFISVPFDSINTIKIDILNEYFRPVTFNSGETIITLEFRKRH